MLEQIAKVTGHRFDENNHIVLSVLRRIERKLPAKATSADILAAEAEVNKEGQLAIASLIKQITAPPPEREYKIKRSLKGQRIDIPAPDGTRYSFGPIWNDSVAAVKGICLAETARKKLEHQARLLGFGEPEGADPRLLAKFISFSFDEANWNGEHFDATKALIEASKFVQADQPVKGAAAKVGKLSAPSSAQSFRFGPSWLNAVRAGTGIAVKTANAAKLFSTAKHFGITPDANETLPELCARIAAVIPAGE